MGSGRQNLPHASVQDCPSKRKYFAGWTPRRLFQLLVPNRYFLPIKEPAKETSNMRQDSKTNSISPHPSLAA